MKRWIGWILMLAALTAKATEVTQGPGYIWWEAEDADATDFTENMAFKPANVREANVLSEKRWIGGGRNTQVGFAEYEIRVPEAGTYSFYVRKFWKHGPFRWRFGSQEWQSVTRKVALLDNAPLRTHLGANWVHAGTTTLDAGSHTLRLELLPETKGQAACFDAFCLTLRPFQARGTMKPDAKYGKAPEGWFAFEPDWDDFRDSPIDLRELNEERAGDKGFIHVKGDEFVHAKTGEPARFWAVNTGHELARMDHASIDEAARFLAKHGVNMVRIHGGIYNRKGPNASQVDPEELDRVLYLVAALKKNGIYSAMSIHFQHWLDVRQDPRIPGYETSKDGRAFAIHFFSPEYQEIFKSWWKAALATKNPYTGLTLAEDPAVGYCEIINEDNFFFWTFKPYDIVPAHYMPILEKLFGQWLAKKYGSIQAAFDAWGPKNAALEGDDIASGRVGVYFSGMLTNNDWARNSRNPKRAEDCTRFLAELEYEFFATMREYIKTDLGYDGPVCGSNMGTADHGVLTPIERWTNTGCDFLDHHGYYGGDKKQADPPHFSMEVGDSYTDRSVLRFDPKSPGSGGAIPALPFLAPNYGGKPNVCSEFAWILPNQYQSEMNVLAAVLGRTTGLDGMVFFALDVTPQWSSRANSYWPIQVPGVVGQWPATALMYRLGLISEGKQVVTARLGMDKLFALQGSPVIAPKAGDDLNEQMAPSGKNTVVSGQRVDPRALVVGRTGVDFVAGAAEHEIELSAAEFIDAGHKLMKGSNGEWTWDYGKGVLQIHAAAAQGVCGFLSEAGLVSLAGVTIESSMSYGTILLVAMDGKPLNESVKILLQVDSQSQDYGYRAEPETGMRTIKDRGTAPIVVKSFAGTVKLKREDASELKVTQLDFNGYPLGSTTGAGSIKLAPNVLYYVIEK